MHLYNTRGFRAFRLDNVNLDVEVVAVGLANILLLQKCRIGNEEIRGQPVGALGN